MSAFEASQRALFSAQAYQHVLWRGKSFQPVVVTMSTHIATRSNKQPYLHNKLSGVGPGHGGALSSSEDPDGPDIEGYGAKETSQHHPLETHRGTLRQHGSRGNN